MKLVIPDRLDKPEAFLLRIFNGAKKPAGLAAPSLLSSCISSSSGGGGGGGKDSATDFWPESKNQEYKLVKDINNDTDACLNYSVLNTKYRR